MGGQIEFYEVGDDSQRKLAVDANVGDLMQWQASEDSNLTAYEVCYPPYQDGRFENIG